MRLVAVGAVFHDRGVLPQKWTSTFSSKVLVEAGYSEQYYNYTLHYEPDVKTPSQNPPYGDISMLELVNPANRLSNAAQMDFQDWFPSYNIVGSDSGCHEGCGNWCR